MNVLRQTLAEGVARLAASGIDSARTDARVLLGHALNKPPGEWIGEGGISDVQKAHFDALIARRRAREPVAYITGHKEFWSLDFIVGPGVLVPRPETEILVEQALQEFPDRDAALEALDFGTGSGCILLAFLSEFPRARGTGIESSPDALAYAARNTTALPAGTRCAFAADDWQRAPPGQFDAIFCNPPYLTQLEWETAQPELRFEPRAALDGGPDGLGAYRSLAPLIKPRLKPTGRLFLEIGAGQGSAVGAILTAGGLETLRIAPDLFQIPRCIVARPQKTVGMIGPCL
jgi:release factor glutamine methyltransferase